MKLPLAERYGPLEISLEGWPSGLRRQSGNQMNASSNPAYEFCSFFQFLHFLPNFKDKFPLSAKFSEYGTFSP